jgi:hypothetical protein
VPLFGACDNKQLAFSATQVEEMDFTAGQVLCRQGESGEEFFVIVSGTAEVKRDGRSLRMVATIALAVLEALGRRCGRPPVLGVSATVTPSSPARAASTKPFGLTTSSSRIRLRIGRAAFVGHPCLLLCVSQQEHLVADGQQLSASDGQDEHRLFGPRTSHGIQMAHDEARDRELAGSAPWRSG